VASTQDASVIDLTGNPIAEPAESSSRSSASGSLDTSIDLDLSVSEDLNPNKIRRSLPMKMKSYDPAQCTDILDSMYEIYYNQEVKFGLIISYITFKEGQYSPPNHYFHFVSSIQAKYAVQPYMDKQEDLNNKMRSILVDWLVEVHFKFKLYPATLWLTVNIIDRFLSKVPIKRARLQLVGISSFFIACKFEEVCLFLFVLICI